MDHAQDPLADTWQSRYYPNMRSRALLERTRLEEERYDSLPPVTSSHPFRGDVPSYYQNSATSNSDDRSFDTADSDSDPFLPSIQDTLVSATIPASTTRLSGRTERQSPPTPICTPSTVLSRSAAPSSAPPSARPCLPTICSFLADPNGHTTHPA